MKRNDYLNFHSNVLWKLAQKQNLVFYTEDRKNYNDETLIEKHLKTIDLSDKNKIGRSYRIADYKIIENQEQLKHSLINRYKFHYSDSDIFKVDYFRVVFHSSDDIKDFFISNSNNLIGSYSLKIIRENISYVKDEDIKKLLTNGGLMLGEFDSEEFKKIVPLIKHIGGIEKNLMDYLDKRHKYVNGQWDNLKIKEILIENFSDNLEYFRKIKSIDEYINIQNSHKDVFLDNSYEKTIYLRLDLNLVQNLYPFPGFILNSYSQVLETIGKVFMEIKDDMGLEKIHIQESRKDKQYQYTHLYFNLRNDSFLNKENIQMLIKDCFEHLQTHDLYTDPFYKIYHETKKWLPSKILQMKLQKELSCEGLDKPKVKI